MRVGRLFSLGFAVSALAYACSTFEGEPIGPTGTDAGAESGGGDAAPDAAADASVDGALVDGGEAGPDSGVYFFDNFDVGGRSPAWTDYFNPVSSDAGDILVEATGLSPPNAFHVANRGNPFYGGLSWAWPIAGSKTRMLMTLDINVVKRPTTNAYVVITSIDGGGPHERDNDPAPVLAISQDADMNAVRFSLYNLSDSDGTAVGQILGKAPLGTWQHIEVGCEQVPGDPSLWKVTWSLAGAPSSAKLVAAPTVAAARSTIIGVHSGNALADVRFDNIAIDLR